jgi:signal transduction histidine kinase
LDLTGLGLSIVKRIADCQSGSAWVESDQATGTLFWFALPLARGHLLRDDFAAASALLE